MSSYIQFCLQDFVRLPLQNQSGQSSSTLPVGPSPSPSSSGLSRAYLAGSGQMNPAIYSAGLVNAGITSVPQPLDIVSEEIDAGSSQLHRWFLLKKPSFRIFLLVVCCSVCVLQTTLNFLLLMPLFICLYCSASSPNIGMGDGGFENDTIAPFSSASTAELQPLEQSNVVKVVLVILYGDQ